MARVERLNGLSAVKGTLPLIQPAGPPPFLAVFLRAGEIGRRAEEGRIRRVSDTVRSYGPERQSQANQFDFIIVNQWLDHRRWDSVNSSSVEELDLALRHHHSRRPQESK